MRKILVLFSVAAVLVVGCAPVNTTTDPPNPAAHASNGDSSPSSNGDDRTAKIGQWVTADDGVTWTVTKLGVTHVSQFAAGGHPGDPALVAYVRIKNGSKHRLDLSAVQVTARTGADGNPAEDVVDVDAGLDVLEGTLAPGRTVSAKYAFAADSRRDLKNVSIEVTPGFDYESGTFEGGI